MVSGSYRKHAWPKKLKAAAKRESSDKKDLPEPQKRNWPQSLDVATSPERKKKKHSRSDGPWHGPRPPGILAYDSRIYLVTPYYSIRNTLIYQQRKRLDKNREIFQLRVGYAPHNEYLHGIKKVDSLTETLEH